MDLCCGCDFNVGSAAGGGGLGDLEGVPDAGARSDEEKIR